MRGGGGDERIEKRIRFLHGTQQHSLDREWILWCYHIFPDGQSRPSMSYQMNSIWGINKRTRYRKLINLLANIFGVVPFVGTAEPFHDKDRGCLLFKQNHANNSQMWSHLRSFYPRLLRVCMSLWLVPNNKTYTRKTTSHVLCWRRRRRPGRVRSLR